MIGALDAVRRRLHDRVDARSVAVLMSTAGVVPLPAIALAAPGLIRDGGIPYLIAVWVTTIAIFVITLKSGRLSDRTFSLVGFVGLAGIALAAYLVTDPVVARGIVTLLSMIPAIAAMNSSDRVILGHTLTATALAWIVTIIGASGGSAALLGCAVSVAVIWLPVFMIGTLRRSLEVSRVRYRELANTDSLTGLPNRRGFLDRIDRWIRRHPVDAGQVGFLVIDVDHFKQINDRHGHAIGDEMLRNVVSAALHAVPHDVIFGRFGGEEFVAVFSASDLAEVISLAERIRISVFDACNITVSIGGIFCVFNNRNPEPVTLCELLDILTHRADLLMYEAKESGRNAIRCERIADMSVVLVHS